MHYPSMCSKKVVRSTISAMMDDAAVCGGSPLLKYKNILAGEQHALTTKTKQLGIRNNIYTPNKVLETEKDIKRN